MRFRIDLLHLAEIGLRAMEDGGHMRLADANGRDRSRAERLLHAITAVRKRLLELMAARCDEAMAAKDRELQQRLRRLDRQTKLGRLVGELLAAAGRRQR